MTYSLLQASLDQTISREELEEMSAWLSSVAKADCALMSRDLHGIVTSGLSRQDAAAFQSMLARKGFAAEVVPDAEIPALHNSYEVQRIGWDDDRLTLTDSMGRVLHRNREELVFVAAGFLKRMRSRVEKRRAFDFGQGRQVGLPRWETSRRYRQDEQREFRIDLFFIGERHRIRMELQTMSVIFCGGRPVRLRDRDGLLAMCRELATLMPPERLNRFFADMDGSPDYLSLHAYEEELRWRFFRLLRADA